MAQIEITPRHAPSPSSLPMEIVERKGIGHPDTICDALAEEISHTLCRFYLEHFGFILHHNVDKALLLGGISQPQFGGGKVLAPLEIFIAGRATTDFQGIKIPIESLVIDSARQWLQQHFHALDPERHVKLHCLIRPGSADLVDLYLRQLKTGIALANDTSCGVGYAPLDELERIVLAVEQHLNAAAVKTDHPECGEDIKVMAVRHHETVTITVSCAFVDRYVDNITDYLTKKHSIAALVQEVASNVTDKEVIVDINHADDPASGSLYLTVTGTSAEAGDDGEVGRGNRVNGLITPYRPMNMEAAAGKNPITHVGKLYNIIAQKIAESAVEEIEEVEEVYCYLVSQIGRPIQDPHMIDLHVRISSGGSLETVRPRLRALIQQALDELNILRDEIVSGALNIY